MLDLKRIQENKEHITELLARKGYNADFEPILKADGERRAIIAEVEKEMLEAAKNLDFERATELRDILFEMRSKK